ncbi:uncharacterized protein Hen1 isoform X2 [Euwallacea fornicatus]|uniref:uncharacterized protein Hen1 isoform X2 n=1 Tax=Euwallacea fornicatus TaxID=995702 RepID=UPI00338ECD2D
MIIIVHCIGIIIFQILRNRKRLKANCNTLKTPLQEANEQILESKFKFDPPLYRQRYAKVYETLTDERWKNSFKKLVDFGCAEYGLFHYIKNLNLEEILLVDIDESILYTKSGMLEPLLSDRLGRRRTPLDIKVFRGSAIDPDYRLRKTDVVTALELIEHLYPDTLDALPYNIFFFIKPKLALFTTPNVDFNVVFGKSSTFRHPDHKFEWTSEQFFDWGTNITQRFPDYSVEFHGIGEGPSNYNNIGCCSQAAIFIRKDMLHKSYISSTDVKSCQCDNNSPCKGPVVKCTPLCNCLCTFCLPDISVGVCTYLSCNLTETDAYRPMKSYPRPSDSFKNLNPFWDFTTEAFSTPKEENLHESDNIFYKLVMNIDYPYLPDTRSHTQILMDTFAYRINLFNHVNSRFYVYEKEQCEIPLKEIVHGEIDVTLEEVRDLLSNAGYRVEKCVIPEINEYEWCIVSMPQEMDVTSNSEVTDGYSSRSECNEDPRLEAKIQPISGWYEDLDAERNAESISNWDEDWDNDSYLTQENKVETHQEPASSSTTSKNPIPDPLFDSGYLKSPSPLETNKPLPNSLQLENHETRENDIFDGMAITPNLSNDDNNRDIKKIGTKEKCSAALVPLSENYNRSITLDPNRLNELDKFRNLKATKASTNNHLKPQNEFKKSSFKDLSPVAGTSGSWSKYRKSNRDKKIQEKKELNEPSLFDSVKNELNCIPDSLNKIELKGDGFGQSELIKDLSPLEEVIDVVNADIIEFPLEPEPQQQEPPQQAVENGDLVNNNRDNEGNNMPVNEPVDLDIDEGIDLLNDNLEDLVPLLVGNVNIIENNNDAAEEARNDPVEVEENPQPPRDMLANNDEIEENSVARPNREFFYDENPEQNLLIDFEFPLQSNHENVFTLNLDTQVALVDVRSVSSDSIISRDDTAGCVAQGNRNSFPNWLLHMLRTAGLPQNSNIQSPEEHDEPHFYCQGDGLDLLGVHPSVIAVEVDEAEDADIDSTTEETLSNNTIDYAEVNPGPSDVLDMSILPADFSLVGPVIEKELSKPVEYPKKATADREETATNGIALIDEVIRAAQEEVCRRYQVDLQEESSQRNSFNAESPHTVINDRCSLETSLSSECQSLIFSSPQSSAIEEHSFLGESLNLENSATSEGELSGEIFEQANSFNDSEKSQYDSTEEFSEY